MVGREVWVWEGLAESEREEQVRAGKEQQREESSRRTHGEKTEPDFAIPRSRPSLIRLALRPSTLPLRLPRSLAWVLGCVRHESRLSSIERSYSRLEFSIRN